MIPIFSRSWLMNTTAVRERLIAPASLRSAWLMRRACRPGSESPMSPSISALGTSAATESITTTSTRTRGESAPIRMMAPLPHVFSICVMARFRAFLRSSVSRGASLSSADMSVLDMGWEPPFQRPEYIPKTGLPPAGSERVRQVLQLVVDDGDAIEAVDVGGAAVAIHPRARGLHQLPPLGAGHRLERASERRTAPRLDLDEGDEVPLPRNEIDLLVANPEPVRQDVPAAGQQILDRLFLAGQAALVAVVGPRGRV